jgi:hypothetical protein
VLTWDLRIPRSPSPVFRQETTHVTRTPKDATRLEVTALDEPRVPSIGSMLDLAAE